MGAIERWVYLDHNATAPVKPEVIVAISEALAECGNPSSVHRFGRRARRLIEDARDQVAASIHVSPDAVIFTSGGSEANALALALASSRPVLLGATEHDSVLKAASHAARIPVDAGGIIRREALRELLASAGAQAFVSIQLANNETGVIQPIRELADMVHAAGGLLHMDAAQAPGRIPVECVGLGADLVTLSAHKMGGPQGVGALIVLADLTPMPIVRGGGQERGWRAGTENLPGIVGFGRAAELACCDLERTATMRALRDQLERQILRLAPSAPVHGAASPRLPNTSCIGMPGLDSETQVMGFDLAGIAVSAGSACSSGKLRRSGVLEAMGVAPVDADSAIRISLGGTTTAAEIDRFCETWAALYRRSESDRAARAKAS
ncbi:MAG TPA: cysteine desulfurase family protein [Alphaproteobacteria bacterium]|nr:cysteine desulfurase family protein [Alphaproteobacteria bacterium]